MFAGDCSEMGWVAVFILLPSCGIGYRLRLRSLWRRSYKSSKASSKIAPLLRSPLRPDLRTDASHCFRWGFGRVDQTSADRVAVFMLRIRM